MRTGVKVLVLRVEDGCVLAYNGNLPIYLRKDVPTMEVVRIDQYTDEPYVKTAWSYFDKMRPVGRVREDYRIFRTSGSSWLYNQTGWIMIVHWTDVMP